MNLFRTFAFSLITAAALALPHIAGATVYLPNSQWGGTPPSFSTINIPLAQIWGRVDVYMLGNSSPVHASTITFGGTVAGYRLVHPNTNIVTDVRILDPLGGMTAGGLDCSALGNVQSGSIVPVGMVWQVSVNFYGLAESFGYEDQTYNSSMIALPTNVYARTAAGCVLVANQTYALLKGSSGLIRATVSAMVDAGDPHP